MVADSHPILPLTTRILIVVVLLSPLMLAVPNLIRSRRQQAIPPTTAPTAEPPQMPAPVLGFAINAHHIGDLPAYLSAVDEISELGANTLVLVTPQYQNTIDSTAIRLRPQKCPTEHQLRAILARAREHELFTILMPIVLIENPEDREWRGLIEPHDWGAWWLSYDRFIQSYVDIARDTRVDMLVVGSELNSTEDQLTRWSRIIKDVRARYNGLITYSANWDRFEHVELWDQVDVMSVSSYFELERERPEATHDEIVAAWQPIRSRLDAQATTWNRPLLMIEIGYPSLPWASAHPWNYVGEEGMAATHDAQAKAWAAFFAAWKTTLQAAASTPDRGVVGFCGYRWDPYHRGDSTDTGYGIVGKPAYEVIRDAFAELGAPSASD